MPEIDYNDPSTYTVKYVSSPDAYPGNGPHWLFEDSTPEEIKAMQQAAHDDAEAFAAAHGATLETGDDATVDEIALATLKAAADAPETITFGS